MSQYDEKDEEFNWFHFDDESSDDEISDEDEIDPQKDTFFTQTYDDVPEWDQN